jgi:hypothetical protein
MSISDVVRGAVEAFVDVQGAGPEASGRAMRSAVVSAVSGLLALLIAILLVALVGKFLWNNVVTELFTFARPARSVWQIIGLVIFMALVR